MSQSPTGTARGPYAKTAAVRRRILESALEVFAEYGYRASTMKNVADRAGISQRGLVHHFASKETLLTAVLADYDAHVALTFPRAEGVHALRGLVDVIDRDLATPTIIGLYAILSAEAASPEHAAHDHYRHRYDAFRAYLHSVFEAVRSQGLLRIDLDSATLATIFMALIDGLQTQWLYDAASVDPKSTLAEFLDTFVLRE